MVEGITYALHLSSIASSMYLLISRMNWSVAGDYVLRTLVFTKMTHECIDRHDHFVRNNLV